MHNPSDIFMGKNIVFPSWGPFLESLGNFSGPKSNFQIKIKKKIAGPGFIRLQDNSSPHFFLSDSRVSEMRAQMKITPHEKRQHVVGRVKNEGLQTKPHSSLSPPCVAFSRVGDFHAHSRFACSTIPEEKWGLPVV